MNHKLLLSLHIMDEPKFKIHKIHNRRRSREQFKIQNSKFKIQKGVLLHSKTSPFATQKESFCTQKGALLKAKRSPFEKSPISLGETILRFMVFPLSRNRESTIFAA